MEGTAETRDRFESRRHPSGREVLFLLVSRYYQEVAPGIALDRAENVSSTALVEMPAGTFDNCLKVRATTPLEPSVNDYKYYAPGIGLVQSNKLIFLGRTAVDPRH